MEISSYYNFKENHFSKIENGTVEDVKSEFILSDDNREWVWKISWKIIHCPEIYCLYFNNVYYAKRVKHLLIEKERGLYEH
jgi:hypothetical protein